MKPIICNILRYMIINKKFPFMIAMLLLWGCASTIEVKEVLKEVPRNATAYNNRGFVYYEQSQYDKAISDYNKAIEINPRHAAAYNNRGLVYYKQSQYDKACPDLKQACELGECKVYELVKKDGYCE